MKIRLKNISRVLFCTLNVFSLVLACIYFYSAPKILLLITVLIFLLLTIILAGINRNTHEAIYKTCILLSVFATIILAMYVTLDKLGILNSFTDFNAIISFIRQTKHWGIIVYIFIVIFQVIALPIPSALIALIGTALYNPTYAFIFMTIGTIVGSVITFALGKIFGKRLVNWIAGEERATKYADMLSTKGRFIFIIAMLFPFFPDDLICLIAGITNMSYLYFTVTITLTRPLMIAFICYFGSGSVIPFSGWGIPVWISLFILVFIVLCVTSKLKNKYFGKHFLRRNATKCEHKAHGKRNAK